MTYYQEYYKRKKQDPEWVAKHRATNNACGAKKYWDIKMGLLNEHAMKIMQMKSVEEISEYLKDNFNLKRSK